MFQFDQADLDFGIYRIMNAKHDEIEEFLNKDLPNDINQGLASLDSYAVKEQIRNINEQITVIKNGTLPDAVKTETIKSLEEQKAKLNATTNIETAENEIYNNLLDFFSRYYDEGDFISQRRYSKGKYAIPYEGEEVKLHWANADQYYIKTSEYFKDYTFSDGFGNKVHFKILDAQTEQNNNKSKEKKFFQLADCDKQFEIIDKELYIYVQYKAGTLKNQKAYNTVIIESFIQYINDNIHEYQQFMTITQKKRGQETSKLEKELNRYTARNTFDYFIHKDLRGFLTQELDFFIKNEVIRLDDIDEIDEAKTKLILTKAKVLRTIAKKIIAFLAQLEEFQKKLFLKKKFVTETNYCITLDRIDESFYEEIAANEEQRKEWVKLFAIDEIKASSGDLLTQGKTAYSEPLTVQFLKENPYLVLDTAFFCEDFKEKIVEDIDDITSKLNGTIVNSDNFQFLRFISNEVSTIKSLYLDPPYNTEGDGFLYKDNYKDSSWLTMMKDRLLNARNLLDDKGIIFISIDDNEQDRLKTLCDDIFGEDNILGVLPTIMNLKGNQDEFGFAGTHEYTIVYAKNKAAVIVGEFPIDEDELDDWTQDEIGYYKKGATLKRTGEDAPREHRPFGYFPILIDKKKQIVKVISDDEYSKIFDKESRDFDDEFVNLLKEKYEKLGFYVLLPMTDGIKTSWRWGFDKIKKDINEIIIVTDGNYYSLYKKQRPELGDMPTKKPKSTLYKASYSSGNGTTQLKDLFTVSPFKNPKPKDLIKDFIQISSNKNEDDIILDFFAGSGTTAHAVIDLNRDDKGNRKYILCEMGEYFDTVTKPRVQKVIYSKDWKDGKPVSREGSSHAFKYIRLESYEDTLNNISLKSVSGDFFESARKDYFLNYMMDFEAKESDCLLNLDKFAHPFDYTMKITRKQECKEQKIDLVETFNYLIGLTVTSNGALQGYDAIFSTDSSKPLTATLKNNGSTYRIKMIEGTNRAGERVLVIWRDLTGDIEKDNAVLDAFFAKKHVNPLDFEYKTIYVNGDNNLQNVKTEDETWKVVLIESEFKRRMFN